VAVSADCAPAIVQLTAATISNLLNPVIALCRCHTTGIILLRLNFRPEPPVTLRQF
jgi:hypothetical protein